MLSQNIHDTTQLHPPLITVRRHPKKMFLSLNYFRENCEKSIISLGPQLDSLLLDQTYMSGWNPTLLDIQTLEVIKQPTQSLPNLLRWFNHIKSFSKQGIFVHYSSFEIYFFTLKRVKNIIFNP